MGDISIDLDVRGEGVILTGLTIGQQGPGFALNLVADDDGNPTGVAPTTTVCIPLLDWDDLERPDTITVTIEPGDHLNGPDA